MRVPYNAVIFQKCRVLPVIGIKLYYLFSSIEFYSGSVRGRTNSPASGAAASRLSHLWVFSESQLPPIRISALMLFEFEEKLLRNVFICKETPQRSSRFAFPKAISKSSMELVHSEKAVQFLKDFVFLSVLSFSVTLSNTTKHLGNTDKFRYSVD